MTKYEVPPAAESNTQRGVALTSKRMTHTYAVFHLYFTYMIYYWHTLVRTRYTAKYTLVLTEA